MGRHVNTHLHDVGYQRDLLTGLACPGFMILHRRLVLSFYAHARLFPSEWSQMKVSEAAHPLSHSLAGPANC